MPHINPPIEISSEDKGTDLPPDIGCDKDMDVDEMDEKEVEREFKKILDI